MDTMSRHFQKYEDVIIYFFVSFVAYKFLRFSSIPEPLATDMVRQGIVDMCSGWSWWSFDLLGLGERHNVCELTTIVLGSSTVPFFVVVCIGQTIKMNYQLLEFCLYKLWRKIIHMVTRTTYAKKGVVPITRDHTLDAIVHTSHTARVDAARDARGGHNIQVN